jgi:transposase
MEAIVERACGIDVHEKQVTVTIIVPGERGKLRKETRTYRTLTRELVRLGKWLSSEGVTHVGMESTGVYWKPVHAVLEGHFTLLVGNAQHIKNVPGRKTDVKDSEWLAMLVRHGLILASFVPEPALRELRELTRYRRKLVEGRSAQRNRVQKLLETANIKLASIVSDVFGVSGMLMLNALVAGTASPADMAGLAKGRMRSKTADLELALEGRLTDGYRFLLKEQLALLEDLERRIAAIEDRIAVVAQPYQRAIDLLAEMPGIDTVLAATIVAEIGTDMRVFRSAKHLAAWAGVAPGNNESAGKQRRTRSRRGNVHLKTALVEAAHGAARKKGGYHQAQFKRLAKRGKLKAYVAIAHSLLIAAYHMLSDGTVYRDLGGDYFDKLNRGQRERRLVRQVEAMGYEVRPRAA